jgi:hypothetical protein
MKNKHDVHAVVTVRFERESGDVRLTRTASGVTVKLER